MVTDQTVAPGGSETSARGSRRGRSAQGTLRVERVIAFCAAAGLLLAYALRGGSYDVVAFEQNGLVIWWIIALGFALGLLPRSRPSRGSLLLLAAFGAYAAWTALSLIWTSSSELTFREVARALDYLGLATLVTSLVDRRSWRAAVAGLGFAAMLVCVIAVGTRVAPAVFGHDPLDAALHFDRLSAPFGYWNAVAAWGAMCVALGLAWSAHDSSLVSRAVALGLVPVAGATVYLTYSRAGVAGSALALILAIGLSRNRITAVMHAAVAAAGTAIAIVAIRGAPQIAHATGTRGSGTVVGALVLAVASVRRGGAADRSLGRRPMAHATSASSGSSGHGDRRAGRRRCRRSDLRLASRGWRSFKTPPVAQTVDPTARLSNLSSSRYLVWQAAIKAFDAHPSDGTGAGTFVFWWNEHATDAEFLRQAHNIWLQNMAELGLPGLLLIIAVALTSLGDQRERAAASSPQPQRRRRGGGHGGVCGLPVPRQRRLDVGVHSGHRAGVCGDCGSRRSTSETAEPVAATGQNRASSAIAVGAGRVAATGSAQHHGDSPQPSLRAGRQRRPGARLGAERRQCGAVVGQRLPATRSRAGVRRRVRAGSRGSQAGDLATSRRTTSTG